MERRKRRGKTTTGTNGRTIRVRGRSTTSKGGGGDEEPKIRHVQSYIIDSAIDKLDFV